jgi:hypothetical protein
VGSLTMFDQHIDELSFPLPTESLLLLSGKVTVPIIQTCHLLDQVNFQELSRLDAIWVTT